MKMKRQRDPSTSGHMERWRCGTESNIPGGDGTLHATGETERISKVRMHHLSSAIAQRATKVDATASIASSAQAGKGYAKSLLGSAQGRARGMLCDRVAWHRPDATARKRCGPNHTQPSQEPSSGPVVASVQESCR